MAISTAIAVLVPAKGILTTGIFLTFFTLEPILVVKVPYNSISKLFLVMKKS